MDTKTQSGFTLLELLITLAVASILLGIGIPSFSGAVKNSQVSSDYSQITQSLFIARSESVKTNRNVTVCPRQSPESKQCGTSLEDWKHGILVFIDNEWGTGEAAATIDSEDELIFVQKHQRSLNNVTAIGSSDGSAATVTPRLYIRYSDRGDGESNWGNGSFLICSDDDSELSRVINVAPTGDVRPGRPSGTEFPRDVFNREACVI